MKTNSSIKLDIDNMVITLTLMMMIIIIKVFQTFYIHPSCVIISFTTDRLGFMCSAQMPHEYFISYQHTPLEHPRGKEIWG